MIERKKKNSKAQLDFIVPIKLTGTTEGVVGKGKRNPKETTEQVKRIVNVFLESLLSDHFPCWKSQSTSPA